MARFEDPTKAIQAFVPRLEWGVVTAAKRVYLSVGVASVLLLLALWLQPRGLVGRAKWLLQDDLRGFNTLDPQKSNGFALRHESATGATGHPRDTSR